MRRAPVRSRILSLSLLALVPACASCSSESGAGDAGFRDQGAPLELVELRFTSTSELRLVPRESTTVGLQVMREGLPASFVSVRVALEGDAHDASLSEVELVSGADGTVQTNLRAASIPTTFRLRATARSGVPVFLPVGVSATGFGDVRVTVDDLSATVPTEVRVEAYSAVHCQHPSVAEGRFGRVVTLPPGELTVSLNDLPVDPGYALVVRGENRDGDEVAFGCVDEVQVVSDAEVAVTVRLGARVQVITGTYEATLGLAAADAAAILRTGSDAVVTRQLPNGDAPYLLDALAAHLRMVGGADALSALAELEAARSTGLDASFSDYLSQQRSGPSIALASANMLISGQVALTFVGALTIEADGETSFTLSSLDLVGPHGSFSGFSAGIGAQPTFDLMTVLDPVGATVSFDPIVIELALGAHLDGILNNAVAASALASWSALSGASSAAGFSIPGVSAACDEACRAAVFAEAALAVRAAWLETLGRDMQRVRLSLGGDAVASDADGDLRADSFHAPLQGDAALGATTMPLVGSLGATRSTAGEAP